MGYARRDQDAAIYAGIDSPFVVVILGPRRVGKSTFVDHYVSTHEQLVWARFNMDVLAERQRLAGGELTDMIEESVARKLNAGEKIWVTIDEVQKCPEAFDQIKYLYDRFKGQDTLKFILTGSAQLDLHHKSAETLAGRAQFFRLREFTLREQVQAAPADLKLPATRLLDCCLQADPASAISDLLRSIRPLHLKLSEALQTQLIWGGLPEVLYLENNDMRNRYTGDYIQTYLEKDIRAITYLTDLPLYQHLLEIYAQITGALKDDTKILQALKCGRNTLIKYTQLMESTLLLKSLPPFIYSTLKRLTKAPKLYLLNNGLISYLTGIDNVETLMTTGSIGHRFENWFLKELQVWLDACPQKTAIHFWRLASGREVDFIVRRGQMVLPFEVTYSEQVEMKKVKNLQAFMQEIPQVNYGFYIYNGKFQVDKVRNIIFIPAWAIV